MANWYYYEAGVKKGPIDSTTLKSLAQHGIINQSTPIETDAGQMSTAGKISGLVFGMQPPPPNPITVNVTSGPPKSAADMDEQILFEGSPAFFRNHILRIIICTFFILIGLLLIIAPDEEAKGVGLGVAGLCGLILLLTRLGCKATKLTITNHKSILRRGILSKRTIELLHEHIRSVGMSQGIFARLLGVGRIDISSAASGVAEISVSGMLDPESIKKLVQQYQRR